MYLRQIFYYEPDDRLITTYDPLIFVQLHLKLYDFQKVANHYYPKNNLYLLFLKQKLIELKNCIHETQLTILVLME